MSNRPPTDFKGGKRQEEDRASMGPRRITGDDEFLLRASLAICHGNLSVIPSRILWGLPRSRRISCYMP